MWRRLIMPALFVGLASVAPARSEAQTLTQRGFAEARLTLYPQDAPNDRVNGVTDLLLRDDVFLKPAPWIQFAAGLDLRLNTHDQVQGSWRIDISDRGRLRPAVSVRRLAGTLARGPITIDVGKQFIRWGKTDIVIPTDRFAPRDFLNVIDTEFLAVSGVRGVVQVGTHTVDVVWVPFFTPSRIPLVNQRWAPAPADVPVAVLDEIGAVIPEGSQAGIRYSRIGDRVEYSLSLFDGFNHLPNFEAAPGLRPGRFNLVRRYPSMRSYGGDAAIPTRWFTIKAEAAYSTSDTPGTDDYALYVIQLERQSGEWQFVGGYAGERVTTRRAAATFAPDRGLAPSVVARAAYTIDPNRSVAFEGAARVNGRGVYSKVEYSQARGQHWRATVGAVLIGGPSDDFLGQYRRNSHAAVGLRYSF
jgi:hypothetical protein